MWGLLPDRPWMQHYHRWWLSQNVAIDGMHTATPPPTMAQLPEFQTARFHTAALPGRQTIEHAPDGSFTIHEVPNVSGPPESAGEAPPPEHTNDEGLEIAGPGPQVSQSFRDEVRLFLEILDSDVAEWWASSPLRAQLRARDATSWLNFNFLNRNVRSELNGKQPIVWVDSNFTAGQAAIAIIREANNPDAMSAGNSFRMYMASSRGAIEVFEKWRADAFQVATGRAALFASIYYQVVASLSIAGEAVVVVDDVSENGLDWRQLIGVLPLLGVLGGRVKTITIRLKGKGARKSGEIKLSIELAENLAKLNAKARKALLKKARAAKSQREAVAILRQGTGKKPRAGRSGPKTAGRPRGKVPGGWVKKNEGMPARARAYQTQITGRTGQVYRIGDVEYDGMVEGVLREAKGPGFVKLIDGSDFQTWFRKRENILRQAKRQAGAAGNVPLEWHVAEPEFKAVLEKLFKDKKIAGIRVIHTPVK